jgi:hypothetical protein
MTWPAAAVIAVHGPGAASHAKKALMVLEAARHGSAAQVPGFRYMIGYVGQSPELVLRPPRSKYYVGHCMFEQS